MDDTIPESAVSEVHKSGHMTTRRSLETLECLTEEPVALSSYALTYVALTVNYVCMYVCMYTYIYIYIYIYIERERYIDI